MMYLYQYFCVPVGSFSTHRMDSVSMRQTSVRSERSHLSLTKQNPQILASQKQQRCPGLNLTALTAPPLEHNNLRRTQALTVNLIQTSLTSSLSPNLRGTQT